MRRKYGDMKKKDNRYKDGNFKASKMMIIRKITISRNLIPLIIDIFEKIGLEIILYIEKKIVDLSIPTIGGIINMIEEGIS